jgi:uncharacterized damage-inducible protein DinB
VARRCARSLPGRSRISAARTTVGPVQPGPGIGAAQHADLVWTAIDNQRRRLAEMLEDHSEQEWDHPSLCRGWTVRQVAAHVALQNAMWSMMAYRGSVIGWGRPRESAEREPDLTVPVSALSPAGRSSAWISRWSWSEWLNESSRCWPAWK